jgi:hypothetical protein
MNHGKSSMYRLLKRIVWLFYKRHYICPAVKNTYLGYGSIGEEACFIIKYYRKGYKYPRYHDEETLELAKEWAFNNLSISGKLIQ